MTYIIISFSVEGWMVPAQKKAELKKGYLKLALQPSICWWNPLVSR